MAVSKYMDVRSRVATCLLLNKLSKNNEYSKLIGVQDRSYYTDTAVKDGNKNGAFCSKTKTTEV